MAWNVVDCRLLTDVERDRSFSIRTEMISLEIGNTAAESAPYEIGCKGAAVSEVKSSAAGTSSTATSGIASTTGTSLTAV